MTKFLFGLCILFALTSCENNDNLSPQDSLEFLNASLTISDGLIISEFIEEGSNRTSIFSPYLFLFSSDGSVTASNTGMSIQGTYRVFRDDGRLELSMTFPTNSELNELSDDWYYISQKGSTIRFEDSGDLLVFQQQ